MKQALHVNTKRKGLVAIKSELHTKGWSNRTAANALGCTTTHLSLVLNGHRASESLLTRIKSLPLLTGIAARKGKATA